MGIELRGNVLVLDDGSAKAKDLVERVADVFPNVYRLTAGPAGDDHVLKVGRKHLNVKTIVQKMAERQAYWALIPKGSDPAVVVSDYLSAARPLLADGFPAFVLIASQPGMRYRRIAVVADARAPITTGSLALAGIGMACRSGASLDVLLLGTNDSPSSWQEARPLFDVAEDAIYLEQALEKAREVGLRGTWVPLGESSHRDQLVLDAVRDGGYDLVLDDLRPMDVGPRIGRLKRVQKQLISGDSIDTAYRLLRDAPCDVGIVLDAVNMRLVPGDAVRFGAVAALSIGMLGAAAPILATPAHAATETATVEAPLDPTQGTEQTSGTQDTAQGADETSGTQDTGAARDADAAQGTDTAAPEAEAPAPNAPVGVPAPTPDQIPQEVSADQYAAAEAAYAAEQALLAQEQAELAQLEAQQAAADQQLALAEADLALDENQLSSDRATLHSAEDALDYAQSPGTGLTDAEKSRAAGSASAAGYDVAASEKAVEESEAALDEAQAAAEVAAGQTAAQQTVVDAQAANVASWGTAMAQAAARTDQVVAPTQDYTITAVYGQPGEHWSSGYHTGLDFAADEGTPIYAAADGVVVEAGQAGAYGNYTVIEHENGTTTHYAHQQSIDVEVGQTVEAGQQIGTLGNTGNSTGPHLHFEVRDASGNTMDPEIWLGDALEGAVYS